MSTIDRIVTGMIRAEHAVIEEMCWASLQDPQRRGVRVDHYLTHVTVRLSSTVPDGEIHHHRHNADPEGGGDG